MKLRKRILACLLSAVMAVSSSQLLTVTALAEENSGVTQDTAIWLEEAEEEKESAEAEDLEQPEADNIQQPETDDIQQPETDDIQQPEADNTQQLETDNTQQSEADNAKQPESEEPENVAAPGGEESLVPEGEPEEEDGSENGEDPDIIQVESIELDIESLSMEIGETAMVQAVVSPDNATEPTVTWESSDISVCTVEDGIVYAVAAGNCTITASVGDKSASCEVAVAEEVAEDEAQLLTDENAEDIMPAAAGEIASGEYGQITWVIDGDGKLTVTGTGDFSDETNYQRAPWYIYRNSIQSAEIKVTGMTNASYMFFGCTNMVSIDVSGFDTSQVTTMRRMFYDCESLVILDLSSFDTSQVTQMRDMFEECKSLIGVDVSSFDTSQVTEMRYMFSGCRMLDHVDLSNFDTSQVKYMERMFYLCKRLDSLDLSSFDTSQVRDMHEMFEYCYELSSINFGDSFDTSQVTNMNSMFANCHKLSSIDLSNFNTGNVTSMAAMFDGCYSLTNIDASNFDTSKVTVMSAMFAYCYELTSVDVSSFDTSQVTNMQAMFAGCKKLASLDLSNFDASKVTSYTRNMFEECSNLSTIYTPHGLEQPASLPGGIWYMPDGTEITEITSFSGGIVITEGSVPKAGPYITAYKSKTVYECEDRINLGDLRVRYINENGGVTAVYSYSTNASTIDMSTEGTKTLTITYRELTYEIELTVTGKGSEEPAKPYITATKKKTVYECGEELKLEDLTVAYYDEKGKVTFVAEYSTNASTIDMATEGFKTLTITYNDLTYEIELIVYRAVEGIAGEVINENYGHLVWAIDDNGKLTVTGTGEISSIPSLFHRAPWYDNRNDITSAEVNIKGMTRASAMFYGCSKLDSVDLSGLDTSQIITMDFMFYGCSNLSSINLNGFDTSQVTNMQSMFYGCAKLGSIDLSGFDTGRVTNMQSMFDGCKLLGSIDVSRFNTSQVTSIRNMFADCRMLSSIDVSHFDTSNVTAMGALFYGCYNLKSIDLSSFDTSRITITNDMDLMFFDCYALSTIHTPLKLRQSVPLPEGTWYMSDGTEVTELPQRSDYSIVITKDRIIGQPYITAYKEKTVYECGDELTLEDLTVEYHDGEENITVVTEYSTNASEINMSTQGTKTLTITYNDLTCNIYLTVTEKSGSDDPQNPGDSQDPDNLTGFHIHFVNEEDKNSVYTGAAIKPAIRVTHNGYELTEGIDYTVKYSNNVKASENAKITVTGKGSWGGKTSEIFTIEKKNLSDSDVEITGVELDENGNIVLDSAGSPTLLVAEKTKASPVLIYYGVKLTSKDFTVEGNQKWTGNGSITIKAKSTGNFSGERKLNIRVISKQDLKKFTVTVDKSVTYDGEEHKLTPVVTDSKTKEILAKTDYTVIYSKDVINAGTVKVTVVGKGYYTGSVTKSYKIKPIVAPATDFEVELSNKNGYTFKGNGVTLKKEDFTVRYNGSTLAYGTDYKVTSSNNKKVGDKAKYKVTFLGNYKGSKAVSGNFTINKATLNDDTEGLKISVPDKVYTGKPGIYKSAPYVDVNGISLKSSEYTVTYWVDQTRNRNEIKGKENNIIVTDEPVTVYVKIVAKGNNYETPNGTYASAEYKVYPKPSESRYNLSKAKVTLTFKDKEGNTIKRPEFIGDGIEVKAAEIKVECKSGKKWEIVPADEYTVEYVNNVYKGKATVLIKANSTVYAGSKAVKFSIVAYNLNFLRLFL